MIGKIIIFLLEIGFGIKFNIVGTISLSELFLVTFSVFYIRKSYFKKYPELKKISWLFLGLLLSQIISEILVSNTLSNSFKGFAVTIVSYFHFYFLFQYFIKDRSIVIYAILGILSRSLIFGTEFEGSLSDVVSGDGATVLKFYIAPILGNILLLLSIFNRKKIISIIILLVGVLIVVLGARSYGAIILISGLFSFIFLYKKKSFKLKSVVSILIFAFTVSYGLFSIYVDQILSGKIDSGNAWQIRKLENPYNPLNLLIMGRTDTFVGVVAFLDEFWTGHGAWAEDKTGKYYYLMNSLKETDKISDRTVIPTHSVIVGYGMQNGIFSLLFVFGIIFFFFIRGSKSLNKNDNYLIISIFFLVQIGWNSLFSPISHFRINLPLYFAFLYASFLIIKHKNYNESFFLNSNNQL